MDEDQRKVARANELSAADAKKRAADDKKEIAISDNVAAAAETSVVSALPPNEKDRDIPLHHKLIDQIYIFVVYVIAATMTSKLQAFKKRYPHPSLFYQASHLATGQAANDTGLNSQNYDHATCQDGDGLLPTTATSAAPRVTIISEGSERQTMYVTDAEVVLPFSRDEEEPKLCKKILLFGGFIFLLVVVFVFGIVFNLQTEVGIVCISFICGKEKKYLLPSSQYLCQP